MSSEMILHQKKNEMKNEKASHGFLRFLHPKENEEGKLWSRTKGKGAFLFNEGHFFCF